MRKGDDDVKSGYTNWIMYDVSTCSGVTGFDHDKLKAAESECWMYDKAKRECDGYKASLGSSNRRKSVKTSTGAAPLMYRLLLVVNILHLCSLAAGDYYSGKHASCYGAMRKQTCHGV